jgi:SAM-dependent methyltransferase
VIRKRIEQTLDQQVESVWADEYLRSVSTRILNLAEQCWRDSNKTDHTERIKGLEIGGAGGITKLLRPEYVVTDIRKSLGVDTIVDATRLPFEDESFHVVYAVDVVHHIHNLSEMFSEIERVLRPGGIFFMREPYWGPVAQLIWRFVHPEDFSLKRLFNVDLKADPMSGNQALAYALLKKTSFVPANLIPKKMKLYSVGQLTGTAFLLSGGATFQTKVPRRMLMKLETWELKHPMWLKIFGFSTGLYMHKSTKSNE